MSAEEVRPYLTNCYLVSHSLSISNKCVSHLLLLHQLRVRTIVHHILSKHRRGERAIDLFRIHVLQFSVQNEIIALRSQNHRSRLSEQDEGEDISVLFATREEECVGVNAVADGAADDGDPMEDKRRLVGIAANEELRRDVQQDGEGDESAKCEAGEFPGGEVAEVGVEGESDILEEPHVEGENGLVQKQT